MTYPVWPAELPQRPRTDGYRRGTADGRQFRQMQYGPPKVRRRTRAAVRPVSLTYFMAQDQVARFERFWDEDTGGGLFVLPDAVNHDTPLLTAGGDVITDGFGRPVLASAYWLVIVGEDAAETSPAGGSHYNVSFQVSEMP